jgi:hypothetical protein
MILESDSGSSIRKGEIIVPKEKVSRIIEVRRLMKKYGVSPSEVGLYYEGEDDELL